MADQSYATATYGLRESSSWMLNSVNVILDGVPQYNMILNTFVFDIDNLPLKSIKRIEFIKGPGGAIYGANSATGVINIYSKDPVENPAWYASQNIGSAFLPLKRSEIGRIGDYPFGETTVMTSYHAKKQPLHAGILCNSKYNHGFVKNPAFAGDSIRVEGKTPEIRNGSLVYKDTAQLIKNRFTANDEGDRADFYGRVSLRYDPTRKCTMNGWATYNRIGYGAYTSIGYPFPSTLSFPFKIKPDSVWLTTELTSTMTASGRADYRFTDAHTAFAQAYYNYTNALYGMIKTGIVDQRYFQTNIELQDNYSLWNTGPLRVESCIGSNVRMVGFRINNDPPNGVPMLKNPVTNSYVIAGFVQEKTSYKNYLDFIAGVKAETWTLLGNTPEISPSVRASFKPASSFTGWAAWSRSVTLPSYSQLNLEQRWEALPAAWYFTLPASLGGLGMSEAPPGAGKWMCVSTPQTTVPTTYYTTEGGIRTSVLPKTIVDLSAYFVRYKDKMGFCIDTTYQTVIPSILFPGDSIVPLYYINAVKGAIYGAENVVRFTPTANATLELSYSLFFIRQAGQSIPSGVTWANGQIFEPDPLVAAATPHHVVRNRLSFDLPANSFLTLSGIWHSRYGNIAPYDYIGQQFKDFTHGGTVPHFYQADWQWDFTIEKTFQNDRWRCMLSARNLMFNVTNNRAPFFLTNVIESYTYHRLFYPATVSPLYGLNVTFAL